MSDILKDLWEGKIAPCNDSGVKDEKIEFETLCIQRYLNLLETSLEGNDYDHLKKLELHHCNLIALQREYAFKQGFSLAMKLNKA